MKFEIKCSVDLDPVVDGETLLQVLSPENRTMKDGAVVTFLKKNRVISQIEGTMSIGTLLNTIDDILKTVILATKVSKTTESL